jgi:plastocyanin
MKYPLSLLGVVVAIVGTACGGGRGTAAGPTTTKGTPAGIVKRLTVTESEYRLVPATLAVERTGSYEIKVVNNGTVAHALEIDGSGGEAKTPDIGPGESATLEVRLAKTGLYELYCPIDGHKGLGMRGSVVVGKLGTATADTSTRQTTTTSGY